MIKYFMMAVYLFAHMYIHAYFSTVWVVQVSEKMRINYASYLQMLAKTPAHTKYVLLSTTLYRCSSHPALFHHITYDVHTQLS